MVPSVIVFDSGPLSLVTQRSSAQPPLSVVIGGVTSGQTETTQVLVRAGVSGSSPVAHVDFYIDGVLQGKDTAAPYTWTLDPVGRTEAVVGAWVAGKRERYGLAPKWLEAGGLAKSATEGLVLILSTGRGMAEIQPLKGGENHWVRLQDLSPPTAG